MCPARFTLAVSSCAVWLQVCQVLCVPGREEGEPAGSGCQGGWAAGGSWISLGPGAEKCLQFFVLEPVPSTGTMAFWEAAAPSSVGVLD